VVEVAPKVTVMTKSFFMDAPLPLLVALVSPPFLNYKEDASE
jgi:hypothetical protein